MKAFWLWLLGLFGMAPVKIPDEVVDETTAYVEPEEFEVITEEEIDEMMDDAAIMDELEDLDKPEERDPSKFAVIIGINLYDPSLNADLNGCVNDADGMYDILTNTYGFPKDNVRMLTDFRATGIAIFERIEWLLSHKVPGDELVLHYSGHGSQVRDRSDDELNDYLDEILCPTDLDWDRPFTDDEIKFCFDEKGEGVFLTFICDSCHSATMTRSANIQFSSDEALEHPEKPRFINPPLDIKARDNSDDLETHVIGKTIEGAQDHVLLSGCRDDQTSSDAYIDGRWQGALTASLIETIKANPNRDWTAIHADVIAMLNVNGYTQKPQLSGDDSLVKGRSIFGS
jgi:metacaspase-1